MSLLGCVVLHGIHFDERWSIAVAIVTVIDVRIPVRVFLIHPAVERSQACSRAPLHAAQIGTPVLPVTRIVARLGLNLVHWLSPVSDDPQ